VEASVYLLQGRDATANPIIQNIIQACTPFKTCSDWCRYSVNIARLQIGMSNILTIEDLESTEILCGGFCIFAFDFSKTISIEKFTSFLKSQMMKGIKNSGANPIIQNIIQACTPFKTCSDWCRYSVNIARLHPCFHGDVLDFIGYESLNDFPEFLIPFIICDFKKKGIVFQFVQYKSFKFLLGK
jgi:hypothetical protein